MTTPVDDDLRAALSGRIVCVTGGAGFIGSHLVDALLDAGATVRAIDDLSNGRPENLASARRCDDRFTFVEGSILDDAALDAATAGASVIFHEAALGSVPRSFREPRLYLEVNATGTLSVLEAARRHEVERVVYAASSSAYGDQPELPLRESMLPRPMSPYAAAKLAAETLMRAYAFTYGLATVSLRYFNIFGPRQRPDSAYAAVIPRWITAMQRGERPTVFGDGTQTRDFTYVENAVRANLLAATCAHELRGDVFNVACGASYSLVDLITALAETLGVDPSFDRADARAGEVVRSWADISRAREVLGYEPAVDFHEGLRRTVASFSAVDA